MIERLKSKDAKIIIFDEFLDYPDNSIEQVKCFKDFHSRSDIIIANRLDKRLAAYPEKVFQEIFFILTKSMIIFENLQVKNPTKSFLVFTIKPNHWGRLRLKPWQSLRTTAQKSKLILDM